MMRATPRGYEILKVMRPQACVDCRFSYLATVRMSSGRTRKMFYCARGDCDNLIHEPRP